MPANSRWDLIRGLKDQAQRLTISYMKVTVVLCFIVLTDLCLDAATITLFLLNIPLHYICPSGRHASADSKRFLLMKFCITTQFIVHLQSQVSLGGGEMCRCCHTRVCICKHNCSCVVTQIFGSVFSHFWCEVTKCVHRAVTFDSTACDVYHSACNISRSCTNIFYCHHYVYLSFAFLLASGSVRFILAPILIQRSTEFVHWIITVLILTL